MKEKEPSTIAGFEDKSRTLPGQCSAFAGMAECGGSIVELTVITTVITGKGHIQTITVR